MPAARRDADEPDIKLSAQQAKSLTYSAGTPKFLQALAAQVRGGAGGGSAPPRRDELDDLLGEGGNGSKESRAGGKWEDREELSDEDDFAGAQIVVLKEGKHLTMDEIRKERQSEASQASADASSSRSAGPPSTIADASSRPGTTKQRAPIRTSDTTEERGAARIAEALQPKSGGASQSGLDAIKSLIAEERDRKAGVGKRKAGDAGGAAEEGEEDRKNRKAQEKEAKNKKARKEKSKAGKGLSFQMDD